MCSDLLREGPSPADGDGHSGRSGSCSPRVRLTSTWVLEQRERHLAPLWRKDVLLPRDLSLRLTPPSAIAAINEQHVS